MSEHGAYPDARPDHWAGLRATGEVLELALLGREGAALMRTEVPNTPRAVLKLMRHLRKRFAVEAARIVFCADGRSPGAGAVLEWMLERGWNVKLVRPSLSEDESEESRALPDVEEIARLAINGTTAQDVTSTASLNSHKLECLRSRRDQLIALRNELYGEMVSRPTSFEEELAREFERLDRRHVQVIEKIIQRLDALIGLQVRGI